AAAGRGAALHLAGGHVVDDALAGDAAAPGLLDHGVAAEDDGVAVLVVVDLRRGGVHPAAVVHLLLHLHRRAGELDHLLVAAAADIGLHRLDIERALGDVAATGKAARIRLVDRAVRAVGGDVHGLVAIRGLGPGAARGHAGQRGEERPCASGASVHSSG